MNTQDNTQFLDFLTLQLEKNNKVYIETESVANGFYFYGHDNIKITCSALPNSNSIAFIVNSADLFHLIAVNIDYEECQEFIKKLTDIVIRDKIESSYFTLSANFENWLNYFDPINKELIEKLKLLEGDFNLDTSPMLSFGNATFKFSRLREAYQNKPIGLLDIIQLPITIHHKPTIDNGNRNFTNYTLYIPHSEVHHYPIISNNLTVGKKIDNLHDMLEILKNKKEVYTQLKYLMLDSIVENKSADTFKKKKI